MHWSLGEREQKQQHSKPSSNDLGNATMDGRNGGELLGTNMRDNYVALPFPAAHKAKGERFNNDQIVPQ